MKKYRPRKCGRYFSFTDSRISGYSKDPWDNQPFVCSREYLLCALDIVLVLLDHLLDHLATDGARLTCSEVAVIALSEVYAYFACCLHLELVECLLCFGHECLVACHNNPFPDSVRFPFFLRGFLQSILIEVALAISGIIIISIRSNMNGNFCYVFISFITIFCGFFSYIYNM